MEAWRKFKCTIRPVRAGVVGRAGGAIVTMAPQDFGISVKPVSTKKALAEFQKLFLFKGPMNPWQC